MKVMDLIKKLGEVDGNSTVYLSTATGIFDFTGLSYDDNNDIEIYVVGGDKES